MSRGGGVQKIPQKLSSLTLVFNQVQAGEQQCFRGAMGDALSFDRVHTEKGPLSAAQPQPGLCKQLSAQSTLQSREHCSRQKLKCN